MLSLRLLLQLLIQSKTASFAVPPRSLLPVPRYGLDILRISTVLTSTQGLQRVNVAKKKVLSQVAYELKTINTHRSKMLKGPVRPYQNSMTRSKSGLQMASDGFVGTELHSLCKKTPARRGKNVPRVRKKPAILRELALESGPLPDSAAETCDASMALQHGTRYLEHSRAISRTGDQEGNPRLGQFVSKSSPSIVRSGVPDRCLTQQWHRVIQHQLSSITAPIRRESDCSASESAAEEWSSDLST
jgi:hypothetical protein